MQRERCIESKAFSPCCGVRAARPGLKIPTKNRPAHSHDGELRMCDCCEGRLMLFRSPTYCACQSRKAPCRPCRFQVVVREQQQQQCCPPCPRKAALYDVHGSRSCANARRSPVPMRSSSSCCPDSQVSHHVSRKKSISHILDAQPAKPCWLLGHAYSFQSLINRCLSFRSPRLSPFWHCTYHSIW